MAEAEKKPSVADDAGDAAEGTRTASRWLASGLGALPGLAVVGAIVRAPGDGGFDATQLALGVVLAALGALIGIVVFARVLSPVRIAEAEVSGFPVDRVPGHPFTSYAELQTDIAETRTAMNTDAATLRTKEHEAAMAKAEAAEAEAAAQRAEAAAKADDGDAGAQERARLARQHAAQKQLASEAAAGEAAGVGVGHRFWSDQLERRVAVQEEVYKLKTADEVDGRFALAQRAVFVAGALIAAGIVLLGLAPNPDPEKAEASPPALVTLTLNEDGQKVLACSEPTVSALKVGGTDEAPSVITLPQPGCASKTLTFPTGKPKPLGTVEADEAVEVPNDATTTATG